MRIALLTLRFPARCLSLTPFHDPAAWKLSQQLLGFGTNRMCSQRCRKMERRTDSDCRILFCYIHLKAALKTGFERLQGLFFCPAYRNGCVFGFFYALFRGSAGSSAGNGGSGAVCALFLEFYGASYSIVLNNNS